MEVLIDTKQVIDRVLCVVTFKVSGCMSLAGWTTPMAVITAIKLSLCYMHVTLRSVRIAEILTRFHSALVPCALAAPSGVCLCYRSLKSAHVWLCYSVQWITSMGVWAPSSVMDWTAYATHAPHVHLKCNTRRCTQYRLPNQFACYHSNYRPNGAAKALEFQVSC